LSSPTSFQSIPSDNALDYVRDSLADFTVPANSNAGLTDSASTNPLGQYFGNNNGVKYKAKTLWIDNLVLQDELNWIGGKPTYKIIWNEVWPDAGGYIVGEVVSRQAASSGKLFTILGGSSIFGVSGVIRRCAFLAQPTNDANVTATIYVDGVSDVAIQLEDRPLLSDLEQKTFVAYKNSSQQTHDLHDYQLRTDAVSADTKITPVGVIVFYDITGSGVEVSGGNTYVNREKITSVGTSLAVPTVTSGNGAVSSVYISNTSSFGVTTFPVPDISSRASGSATTNQIVVDTGLGGSFPVGSICYMPGTTNYFGNVLSVSTDTLVMGVTLPVNYTFATLSIIAQAGPTFAIGTSLYETKFEINFNDFFPAHSELGESPVVSSPNLNYRVWGTYGVSALLGLNGVVECASGKILQIDGNYDALEFTYRAGVTGAAGIHATYSIDGLNCFNSLEAIPNQADVSKNILTNAGIGYHSAKVTFGASCLNSGLTKITGYRRKHPGASLGILSDIYTGQTFIPRLIGTDTQLTAVGSVRRIFADSLEFTSGWVSGFTASVAGGVAYYSTSAAQNVRLQYYGSAFAILGSITGGSFALSVDGSPQVLAPMNTWIGTTLSEDFHILDIVPAGQTLMISAIDYLQPHVNVLNRQKFYGQEVSGENKQSIEKDGWGRLQITSRSISPLNRQRMYVGSSVGIGGYALASTAMLSAGTIAGQVATLDLNSQLTITTSGNPIRLESMPMANIPGAQLSAIKFTSVNLANILDARISLYRTQIQRGGSLVLDGANNPGNPVGVFRFQNGPTMALDSWSSNFLSIVDDKVLPGSYTYFVGVSLASGASANIVISNVILTAKELM
jgi:hypothetical protein